MATTYYFSHDYDASSDIKIMNLIRVHKSAGVGLFWRLTELLYSNDNSFNCDYDLLAYELREDIEFVKSVINDFDLFVVDDNVFYSRSIEKRLNQRFEKSKKGKNAAEARWSGNADNKSKKPDTDDDVYSNIDDLKQRYISNERLIKAFCDGQNTTKENILVKLEEFNSSLSQSDKNIKTWEDYTSHFRNWFKFDNEKTIKTIKNNKLATKPIF